MSVHTHNDKRAFFSPSAPCFLCPTDHQLFTRLLALIATSRAKIDSEFLPNLISNSPNDFIILSLSFSKHSHSNHFGDPFPSSQNSFQSPPLNFSLFHHFSPTSLKSTVSSQNGRSTTTATATATTNATA